uniref:Protein kinase domain-containing protein n=1 Tax=viral metagenome TaxID=1070528 RepID=A0A6C0ADT1_9ZZZZ
MSKKIGGGDEGCVYKTSNEMCFKIGFSNSIMREFSNNKLLPKLNIFYDTELVSLEQISDDNYYMNSCKIIKKIQKTGNANIKKIKDDIKKIENYNSNNKDKIDLFSLYSYLFREEKINQDIIIKMNMPYLNGKTLDSIFKKLKKDKLISYSLWIENLKLLVHLYLNVEKLNKNYNIYHNDLHNNNVIIFKDKIYLIDFGLMSFKPDKNHDLKNIQYMIEELVDIGSLNKKINKKIISGNITIYPEFDINKFLDLF